MIPRRLILASILLTAVALDQVGAQAARSPFMPPSVEIEAVPESAITENAELQFCGVFGDGEDKRFLIYNVTTRRSSWLRLGQEGPDEVFVDGFDSEQSTVNVRQGGRVMMTLALQAASITGGTAGVPAAVALTGNTQKDLVSTVRVNPTPTDERRRLEAVAAEVRRRRAVRAEAASGAPAPANR